MAPEYDAEIRLDAVRRVVLFRDHSVPLTFSEYLFLQSVLLAPEDVLSKDDLIGVVWGVDEPETPENNIRAVIYRIRNKLREIDPVFDRLRTNHTDGFYWAKKSYRSLSLGRFAVALRVYEGYADGQPVKLNRQEHQILIALMKRLYVSFHTVGLPNQNAFGVLSTRLNNKFKPILGGPLLRSTGCESNLITLNRAIL